MQVEVGRKYIIRKTELIQAVSIETKPKYSLQKIYIFGNKNYLEIMV